MAHHASIRLEDLEKVFSHVYVLSKTYVIMVVVEHNVSGSALYIVYILQDVVMLKLTPARPAQLHEGWFRLECR